MSLKLFLLYVLLAQTFSTVAYAGHACQMTAAGDTTTSGQHAGHGNHMNHDTAVPGSSDAGQDEPASSPDCLCASGYAHCSGSMTLVGVDDIIAVQIPSIPTLIRQNSPPSPAYLSDLVRPPSAII